MRKSKIFVICVGGCIDDTERKTLEGCLAVCWWRRGHADLVRVFVMDGISVEVLTYDAERRVLLRANNEIYK